ncbi:flagellar protein FlgN [Acidithiobacillus sulfurivorans]|uniref:Flagellar protein FlgN n=1 Tax=Acidithiobacillus sulfurivorans TaxID=1958756 RepID=A0ABS5ZZ04_9PROT|nr:flagellar protein FlgN [Acidithiobacillus sulfurivorans]MBU2760457.1 flagellar protein FlgN [Acidithiobacillus sulfurivorans]
MHPNDSADSQENLLLTQLQALLDDETECLKSGQMEELQRIATEKMRCFADLQSRMVPARPSTKNSSDDAHLRNLLNEIMRKNQLNGQIISALERFNQGAWEIFFGAQPATYSDLGTAKSTAERHLIGSA